MLHHCSIVGLAKTNAFFSPISTPTPLRVTCVHFAGQIYSFSLNNPKDKVYKTLEDTKKEDDSYLGYSSTTGDFNGDGTQGVAVGKPRGARLLGN